MLSQISSLNYLRTFYLAAKNLSFKVAANTLNITPTAVSHQIKALEDQLQTTLFARHIRAVTLTQAGEQLFLSCAKAFAELDGTLNILGKDKNSVTISCCHSFAALWLAPKSTVLASQFVNKHIQICASDHVIDFDKDKHIDVALRYGMNNNSENEILLITEQMTVYQSTASFDAKAHKTLFVTQWANSQDLPNIPWQAQEHLRDFKTITFEQEYFVLQAIMSGQGVGLLSNVLAKTALEQGWIKPIETLPNFEGYSYWLRVNPAKTNHHLVNQFCSWFIASFKA